MWGLQEEYAGVGNLVGPSLSQGKSVEIERRMKRCEGTISWRRLQARPIDRANPVSAGTIWIIEDAKPPGT